VNTEVNDLTRAPPEVTIERQPRAPHVRRAADALGLLLALVVLLAAQMLAILDHTGVRTTEGSVLRAIATVPPSLRDALTVAGQVVVVLLPAGILIAVLAGRRFALAGRLVVAALAGAGAGALVSYSVLHSSHPAVWPAELAGRGGILAVTFPPVAWLSALTAMLTVAGAELSRGWRAGLWWLIGAVTAVEVLVGGFLLMDAVVAASAGVSIGFLVLLAFGGPDGRPSPEQVVLALQVCGVDLAALHQQPSGPGRPDLYRATTREGTVLAVRVFAPEDRDRDRLVRLARWLLVRDPQDDRAGTAVLSTAEHEMLAMVAATRAGARVPDPVVAYPVAGGSRPSGALVAWIDVDGRRLADLSPEDVSSTTLADLWHNVQVLQRHRLAHRRLRSDSVLVDTSGRAWLFDLALAELGATERQLAIDVAELLASLAVLIGAEPAARSAVEGLGAPAVTTAAAYVQPLALSGRTLAAVRDHDRARSAQLSSGSSRRGLRPGGRPNLLADVRTAVGQATGEAPAKLESLGRFTWKRTLALLGALVVIYLVLPQLANAGMAIRALRSADWWWVLAAVPALFVGQAFGTLLLLGAIPAALPFGPTYMVQFGGSFLNRVTPNNVGGMALSFRYLQKAGVDSGAATASVGLEEVANIAGTVVLVAVFFALAGRRTAVHVHVHLHQWVLLLVTAVVVGCALAGLTRRGRQFFHDKVWAFFRSAGSAIAGVAKSPHHVALLGVGALGGPLVQIVALGMCVHAVGGQLPFVQVGAIYLGAHFVASAAPVPGGLGALEAALIAGLSAVGMPIGAATSAVLIYRLLTFWLNIPVGWVSLKIAQGRGYV
jgi:uncharacterized protein (TIRG00374 family)